MKKTIKGYLLGFLTAAILISGATYAAQTVSIMINGTELIPTDVNGNRVDPILVDGTTYLPVRAIASALGLDVDWDEETYTVLLTEPEKHEEEAVEEAPAKDDEVIEETVDNSNVIEGIAQIISINMDKEISKIQDKDSKKIYTVDGVFMLGEWGSYKIVDGKLEYLNIIDHYGWTRGKIEKTGYDKMTHFDPKFYIKLTDGTILTLDDGNVKINGTRYSLHSDNVSESLFKTIQSAIGTGEIWYITNEDGYVTKVDKAD